MKKSLLTLGLAALAFGTFAQSAFIIWDGTNKGAAHSTPSALGSAVVKKDTLVLGSDTVYYLSVGGASVSYYAGGVGVATFSGPGVATPMNYLGSVSTTTVGYLISTLGSPSPVTVRLDFKTSTGSTYGFEETFSPNTTGLDTVLIPLSQFKLVNTSNGTFSTPLADTALALLTSEFQFNASTKASAGNGLISFNVAELTFITGLTLGTNDVNLSTSSTVFPNPCNTGVLYLGQTTQNYTLSTMSGAVVKQGSDNKIDVSNLEKGIYFVNMGGKTSKVIIN